MGCSWYVFHARNCFPVVGLFGRQFALEKLGFISAVRSYVIDRVTAGLAATDHASDPQRMAALQNIQIAYFSVFNKFLRLSQGT